MNGVSDGVLDLFYFVHVVHSNFIFYIEMYHFILLKNFLTKSTNLFIFARSTSLIHEQKYFWVQIAIQIPTRKTEELYYLHKNVFFFVSNKKSLKQTTFHYFPKSPCPTDFLYFLFVFPSTMMFNTCSDSNNILQIST